MSAAIVVVVGVVLAASCGSRIAGTARLGHAPARILWSEPLAATPPALETAEAWTFTPVLAPTQPAPEPLGTVVAHGLAAQITAYVAPDPDSAVIETFAHPTERGGPQVFQGLGEPVDGWLEVRLPVRPNGTTGWIRVDDVDLTRNPYRIELDVSDYELRVFRHDDEVVRTTVSIGTGDTPTPIGQFYLIELLRPSDPDGLYGPFAYGLSGFSTALTSFNGGPGIIGIHGTNEPELLGSDVSHGCVRVGNDVISDLAEFLPLGTPVTIRR